MMIMMIMMIMIMIKTNNKNNININNNNNIYLICIYIYYLPILLHSDRNFSKTLKILKDQCCFIWMSTLKAISLIRCNAIKSEQILHISLLTICLNYA